MMGESLGPPTRLAWCQNIPSRSVLFVEFFLAIFALLGVGEKKFWGVGKKTKNSNRSDPVRATAATDATVCTTASLAGATLREWDTLVLYLYP